MRLFEDVGMAAGPEPALRQPFLQACHAASRVGGHRNRRAALCDETSYCTFDTCRISGGEDGLDDGLYVLCHRRFGLIAFARSDPTGMRMPETELCAPAAEAECFAQFGELIVPPLGYLLAPVTPSVLEDLTPSERNDVTYWQPARFADIIFNHWD